MENLRKVAGFIPTLLYSQLAKQIAIPATSFADQTVIVTGSNVGLGLEAARHIARLGARRLILAVRSTDKGQAARRDILASTGAEKTTIDVWQVDMADVKSIKAFAERAAGLERLDAVVLNAGIFPVEFKLVDGMESTLAVNTVHTLLLALLLIPTMRKSAETTGRKGRLSIVGSDLMYVAPLGEIDTKDKMFDRLNDPKTTSMGNRYPLSKQLLFWAVKSFGERHPVEETKVIVSALTPGYCRSTLQRDMEGSMMATMNDFSLRLIGRTTEVGGRTLVHAVSPDLPTETHGKFLMDDAIASEGLNVTSATGQRLAKRWNEELFSKLEDLSQGCTKI